MILFCVIHTQFFFSYSRFNIGHICRCVTRGHRVIAVYIHIVMLPILLVYEGILKRFTLLRKGNILNCKGRCASLNYVNMKRQLSAWGWNVIIPLDWDRIMHYTKVITEKFEILYDTLDLADTQQKWPSFNFNI